LFNFIKGENKIEQLFLPVDYIGLYMSNIED